LKKKPADHIAMNNSTTSVENKKSKYPSSILKRGGSKHHHNKTADSEPLLVKEKKVRLQRQHSPNWKQDPNIPNAAAASKKNMWERQKKKPRAVYQAEIDKLKKELTETQLELSTLHFQLTDTNELYATLSKWAESAPAPF
jgi:hypothetical protein